MENEIPIESVNSADSHEEKEEPVEAAETLAEPPSTVPTVSDLDDVQSFCAEFHIKVENAVGIRPWLQFSETNFSGETQRFHMTLSLLGSFRRGSHQTIRRE